MNESPVKCISLDECCGEGWQVKEEEAGGGGTARVKRMEREGERGEGGR